MGGMMGGSGGESEGSNTSGVGNKLRRQRAKNEEALARYNQQAAPFFNLAQNRGEFGQSFYPALRERIENPTASPTFQLYGNEGVDILRSNFARTGSPSSGPAQVAAGRYLAGLGAHQIDKADNMLLNAANFQGFLPTTQEPQYLGLNTQLAINEAQAKAAAPADTGSNIFSGIFGAIGTAIGAYYGGPQGAAMGGQTGSSLGGLIDNSMN